MANLINGYHRVGIKVSGTSPYWTYNNADVLNAIKAVLDANGIGYENIGYETTYGSLFAFVFTVIVIAPDGQSDGEVVQLILNSISSVLTNATATVVNPSTPFSSSNLSNVLPAIPSLSNLFGNSSTAQVAGFGVSTLVLLGLGITALFLLKSSTIPRRLR